jgi:hypothetical protein
MNINSVSILEVTAVNHEQNSLSEVTTGSHEFKSVSIPGATESKHEYK